MVSWHREQRGSRTSCLHHPRVVVPVNQKAPSFHNQKTGTVYRRPSRRSVAITPMYGCLRNSSRMSCFMRPIGVNSMIPMVVAASLGVPIVDADGMGRAFPEIQMVTPTLHGVSATPMALADEKGNQVLLETPDNFWTERLARTVTIQMGCSACIALYVMQGTIAKKALIPGTLSLAREIGHTLLTCRAQKRDPIEALTTLLHGRRLCEGKIIDVRRRTERGFARGELDIVGTGRNVGAQCRISFRNENLVFWRDGRPEVTVPDLITVVDEQTGLPITTDWMRLTRLLPVPNRPRRPMSPPASSTPCRRC